MAHIFAIIQFLFIKSYCLVQWIADWMNYLLYSETVWTKTKMLHYGLDIGSVWEVSLTQTVWCVQAEFILKSYVIWPAQCWILGIHCQCKKFSDFTHKFQLVASLKIMYISGNIGSTWWYSNIQLEWKKFLGGMPFPPYLLATL